MGKINLSKVTMKTCWVLVISILLISGCASSSQLISPKQLGPKKILLFKGGDGTGEESLKLAKKFQEITQHNVVLNPDKYISAYNLDGYSIPKETLQALYKDEIDVFDNNGYLKTFRGDKPYGGTKSVRYWWHWIMAEATANIVVYDTESASQIYTERYPEKSKLSGFSFSDQGGWVQTSRAARGLYVFVNADWKGRFLSSKKNENNPTIRDGIRIAEDEAIKRFLTYVARLKKKD